MRIVALHGQLGSASDWDNIRHRLSSFGHDFDAIDLWSFLEGGSLDLDGFGEKLNELEESDEKAILLGYSMGGRLALHALLDDPGKWEMVIIVSAHGGLAEEDKQARRNADDTWRKKVEELPWSELLDQWNGQGVLANNMMPERESLEELRSEIAKSFGCWSLAEQENLCDDLREVDVPVLFITGAKDEKFTIQGELLKQAMRGAELSVIPGAGHRVPWEDEEGFVSVVSRWISEKTMV